MATKMIGWILVLRGIGGFGFTFSRINVDELLWLVIGFVVSALYLILGLHINQHEDHMRWRIQELEEKNRVLRTKLVAQAPILQG